MTPYDATEYQELVDATLSRAHSTNALSERTLLEVAELREMIELTQFRIAQTEALLKSTLAL